MHKDVGPYPGPGVQHWHYACEAVAVGGAVPAASAGCTSEVPALWPAAQRPTAGAQHPTPHSYHLEPADRSENQSYMQEDQRKYMHRFLALVKQCCYFQV